MRIGSFRSVWSSPYRAVRSNTSITDEDEEEEEEEEEDDGFTADGVDTVTGAVEEDDKEADIEDGG